MQIAAWGLSDINVYISVLDIPKSLQQFRANLAQKVQNVEKMPLKLTSKIKIVVKKNIKLKFDAQNERQFSFKSKLKYCFLHII